MTPGRIAPVTPLPNLSQGRRPAVFLGIVSLILVASGFYLRAIDSRIAIPTATPATALPVAGPQDRITARFVLCSEGRGDCVVDGDNLRLAGERYRLLDINAPEISSPHCDAELALGEAASRRLRDLLNAGPFSLASGPEQTDSYGRKLRRIIRGGRSLGDVLVAEGLAEPWQGYRRNWC